MKPMTTVRGVLMVTAALLCFICCDQSAFGQTVFVNELHYDDTSVDTLEAVEIAAPAGTDLGCYKLVFYNGATTNEYATFFLSGIVPDQCNGYGTLNFLIPGIQNGSPDGFALVYDPFIPGCSGGGGLSVIQFLSYEGSFTAGNGDAAGMTSTDIGVSEPNSTPNGQSLQLTGAGTTYGDFSWLPGPQTNTYGLPNPGQTFGGPVCITGIVADRLSFSVNRVGCTNPGDLFDLVVCATDSNGDVDTSFSGNITISQLSGPGSLSGVLTLPTFLGCANFTGLSLSAVGTYQFAASGGPFTGTSDLTYVTADCDSCPWMSSALIDACGSVEGINEILFLNSGDYAIPVDGSQFSIDYGASSPPATSYATNLGSNQDYIDSLNTWANCAGLFVNAIDSSPIPPNSDILLMNIAPGFAYDYSALCGDGPFYVLFSFDPSWISLGNFKNCVDCGTNGSLPRFFRLNFSGLPAGPGCDFTYQYTPCSDLICSGNGDGLNFAYGGGSPIANWSACNPVVALDISQDLALLGKWEGAAPDLQWNELKSPDKLRKLEIQRKVPGSKTYETILDIEPHAAPNSFRDLSFPGGYQSLFYRLRLTGNDGESAHSNQVEIQVPAALRQSIQLRQEGHTLQIGFPQEGNYHFRWFDLAGRQLGDKTFQSVKNGAFRLPEAASGLYLYRVSGMGSSWSGKIFLAK